MFDYIHYSLVMHRARKTALYTATNYDGERRVAIPRASLRASWQLDERVGLEHQVGAWGYGGEGAFDRGHLTRRLDVQWGRYELARDAARSTFFYTNAAPQHHNFNQDEWLDLENWILSRAVPSAYRLQIFTGPVLADDDPTFGELPSATRLRGRPRDETRIPQRFWKVVVVRDVASGGDDLAALAFMMDQSSLWDSRSAPVEARRFQVPILHIERATGLDFGALRELDELSHRARLRERGGVDVSEIIPVASEDALVWPEARRRGPRPLASELRIRGRSMVRTVARVADKDDEKARSGGRRPTCGCDSAPSSSTLQALTARVDDLCDVVAELMISGARGLDQKSMGDVPGSPLEARTVGEQLDRWSRLIVRPGHTRAPTNWDSILSSMKPEDAELRACLESIAEIAMNVRRMPTIRSMGRGARRLVLDRIVNGLPSSWEAYPDCVAVGQGSEFFCTGVLVSPTVVLSAAHCCYEGERWSPPTTVFIGDDVLPDINETGMTVPVTRALVHPEYETNYQRDICALFLAHPVPSVYKPIRVASTALVRAAQKTILAGFGNSNYAGNIGFGKLRSAESPMAAPRAGQCEALATALGFDPAFEYIAGHRGFNVDTCTGDSGGPSYIKKRTASEGDILLLAGLTSRATAEATRLCGDGGVYSIVSTHLEWLERVGVTLEVFDA